jgi:MoaA/NifB/PqqE/SkfB family radical SAM enzyme
MCSKPQWTRKPLIMKDDIYEKVLKNFLPYKDRIEKVSFFNYGEPLIDPDIGPRIARARALGFRGTGLSTNATELTPEKSLSLLDAGLETLICSLDGVKAETHEAIRPGARFNEIVENILNFIKLRSEHKARTRLVIRFTAQQMNMSEWPDFKEQWLARLDAGYNDIVFFMRVHSWGEGNENFKSQDVFKDGGAYLCHDFLTKQYVFADGSVAFCCSDCNGFFKDLGNAAFEDPIEIYNKPVFRQYRDYMRQGRIRELALCKKCSIPMSRCNVIEYSPDGKVLEFEAGRDFIDEFMKSGQGK